LQLERLACVSLQDDSEGLLLDDNIKSPGRALPKLQNAILRCQLSPRRC